MKHPFARRPAPGTILALAMTAASLAALGPILWTVYRPGAGMFDVGGRQYGHDFLNYWAAPRIAFSGHVRALFDLQAYYRQTLAVFGGWLPRYSWSYPPSFLVLLWPLAQLPYFWALAVWLGVLTPLFVWVGVQPVARERRWAAALMLLAAPPCLINVAVGQNGFLTGALLLGGLSLLPKRPALAGVLFGLMTVKPHLGLALAVALLALGAWRAILTAGVTALALVAASALCFGWEPWKLYLTVMPGLHLGLLASWGGFYTTAMASVLATLRALGASYASASLVQLCVSVATLAAVAWAVRRTEDARMRALVVVLAMPLATPYAFNYDLVAMSAMLGWRLLDGAPLSPARRMVYAFAWLCPGLMMTLAFSGPNLMIAPVLLAFAACIAEVAEPRMTAAAPRAVMATTA